MSEVEKIYENAEVEPINFAKQGAIDFTNTIEIDGKRYPEFTAEKQIAILNFCLKWGQVHLLRGIDDEYRIENCCYRQGYQPTIADAIANYINEKWEKLTPEERKQIKEILE